MEIKGKWILAALLFVLIGVTVYASYIHPMYEEKSARGSVVELHPVQAKDYFFDYYTTDDGKLVVIGYLREVKLFRINAGTWHASFEMENLNTSDGANEMSKRLTVDGYLYQKDIGNISLPSHLQNDPVKLVFSQNDKGVFVLEKTQVVGGGEKYEGNVSNFSHVAKKFDANYTTGKHQEYIITNGR